MRPMLAVSVAAALAATACARQATVESTGDVAPVTPATSRALPVGATMTVRLDQAIGTKTNKVGDTFTATVDSAVRAQDGSVVVPAGAKIHGKVTGVDASDNVGEPAAIRLQFERLTVNGTDHPFSADVLATNLQQQGESRDETLKKAGIGAAAGAVLGAIIGEGDVSKILAGGAIGAAAGTVISLGTGDVEAVLPAGSTMTLRTTQPVTF